MKKEAKSPQKKPAAAPKPAKPQTVSTVTFNVEVQETAHRETRTAEHGVQHEVDFERTLSVFVSVPVDKAESFDAKKAYSDIRDAVVSNYADPTLSKIEVLSVSRVSQVPSIFIG